MASLSVEYLGLRLSSPIVVSSGPLTKSVESLKKCEEYGAGAVVLKSIFEEQILKEADAAVSESEEYLTHAGAETYMAGLAADYYIERYSDLIKSAKKELSIPVIASINCQSLSAWLDYAGRFEAAGADALELNYYPLVSDTGVNGETVDEKLLDFARTARKRISLPLSIKLGRSYSALSWLIKSLDDLKIDGVVLFNRAFRPDIDLEDLSLRSARITSSSDEYADSLRWTALMSGDVKMDIAANTGIHSGSTAAKMILAGAKVVEVCSHLMEKGVEEIAVMNKEIESFMDKKGYGSLDDFRGLLSQERHEDNAAWERVQFLRTI